MYMSTFLWGKITLLDYTVNVKNPSYIHTCVLMFVPVMLNALTEDATSLYMSCGFSCIGYVTYNG